MTHSDFLNKLCNTTSNFDDSEMTYLFKISSVDWLSWLDEQNGRKKLVDFVNKTKRHYNYVVSKIGYLKDVILNLSARDSSRFTDPLWSSISQYDKNLISSIMTLPYPDLNINFELIFKDVKLPTDFHALTKAIDTSLRILIPVGFSIHEFPQLLKYFTLVVQAINYNIANMKKDKINHILIARQDMLDRLFFIFIHPYYHKYIESVDIFINYMVRQGPIDTFKNYDSPLYSVDLQIFANSVEAYLVEEKQKGNDYNNLIKIEMTKLWWKNVCKNIFINHFKHDTYETVLLNQILKNNPFFMDKMLECAQLIRRSPTITMLTWKKLAIKLPERKIFKNSEDGGFLAQLLYQVIGVPCLDILTSDSYVNSLSDDDKELLTLWTHACNLFQQKSRDVTHHQQQQQEQEQQNSKQTELEIKDLTRKPWLQNRLHQIFMQCPKTKESMMLYRGLLNECNVFNKFSKNPIAVSFDKKVATSFANKGQGCILYIMLPKNSNILFIDRVSIYMGEESEILLMSNSTLTDADDENKTAMTPSLQSNEKFVEFNVDEIHNKTIVPIPKPSFLHRDMTLEELGILLIKSKLINNISSAMDCNSMLEQLADYDPLDYNQVSEFLFNAIRTFQIVHCGFGDVQLAIADFWRLSFAIFSQNQKLPNLINLREYCNLAWVTRKSLLIQNKVATALDALQDFVRPFVTETDQNEML